MKRFPLIRVILLVVSTVSLIFAGNTGKISGLVTEEQSGFPLAGANIIIEGLAMGSASDLDGNYVILNVPPGVQTLKVRMIGYKTVTVTEVQVTMNLTTIINVQMSTEVLGMEEIVVVAKRPIVVKDIAHSEFNIESKQIESLPVTELSQVVGMQAGVKGFSVRGGAERQTALIVDGFVMSDERSNQPVTSISLASIQEVQIQSGGFNAEYSNARSGVVNVVTTDGDRIRYSGMLNFTYRPPAPKHFGISPYDEYSYFNRVFFDPDVCYDGTTNGAWDIWTRKQYPTFEGWISQSNARLNDTDPTNDLTPEGIKRLYEWQHRRQGDIKKADYVADFGFGGPVPVVSDKLGNLRFYLTYSDSRDMLLVPLSRDAYTDKVGRIKLTADITPKMSLVLTGQYNIIRSAVQYEWTTTPTGAVLRSDYTIASLTSSTKELLYVPGRFSPTDIYNSMIGAKINQILSSKSYYDVVIQYDRHRYNTYQMGLRDTSQIYEILPGYYVDEAPYGYWGYGTSSVEGLRTGGWMNLGRDSSIVSTIRFNFDLVSQLTPAHQVKTGLSVVLNDMNINSSTVNPGMTTWNRSQVYQIFPYRIGAYLSDKMEYEGFIANIGLNMDISNSNTDVYLLDEYDSYFKSGYGSNIEDEVETEKSKPKLTLSPRLSVSHPITENSKLYFNYGHYRSEPASTYRFRLQREYNGLVTSIGNPNLDLEKTVSYELGYSHNLLDMVLLNVAAYYKDITNQIDWIYYQNINSSVQYNIAANNNYEDIRGFEITLDKKTGNWFTGFINYTYMISSYGYFGIKKYYQNPTDQRTYLADNPYQIKPHPQPYARANIDLHTPLDYGMEFMGLYPFGGWNWNLLVNWTQGSYATFNPTNVPGLINNVQWRDNWNIDTRLIKNFNYKKFRVQLYVDITNLFNLKYLSYAGFTSNQDYLDYMESLHLNWEEGIQHGNDRLGVYRQNGVEYIPMQETEDINSITSPDSRVLYYNRASGKYVQYQDGQWQERSKNWISKEILDKKAYIDMPNNTSFAFLYPREIKFGLKFIF
ncbi:TonB-dependent receptor [bacterium]|nr:TonB-dependent receptor [bacterium]